MLVKSNKNQLKKNLVTKTKNQRIFARGDFIMNNAENERDSQKEKFLSEQTKIFEQMESERRTPFEETIYNEKFALLTGRYFNKKAETTFRQMETVIYNDKGEETYRFKQKLTNKNGSGFVISYTDKICELIENVPTGSILRVFFYLAHHQQYGSDGIQFGYRCSYKHLYTSLHLDRTTAWDALKWLREHFLVLDMRIDGQTEFMVNPNYITIGTDKKARLREWNERWVKYWQKKHQAATP